MSVNAPLVAPQTKAMSAARLISSATRKAPKVRYSSMGSLADAGVEAAAWLRRLGGPVGIDGQPRGAGVGLARVERGARARGQLQAMAGERVHPRGEREHVVGDRPALRLAHRVGERRHRGAVEPERHGAEDVAHARAALELAAGEVGRAARGAGPGPLLV